MSLGKGTGNVVIRVFDIFKKEGGNGDGPEIREEVHKIATKINRAETLNMATVREMLHWSGIGGEAIKKDRTEEIDRICTKEKGKSALRKFRQHKGL
eukprot:4858624-Pleurochrysis_carterae.AAC.1